MPKKSSLDSGPELVRASRAGNLKKVKELIAQGTDVNYNALAGTPLANAVRAGHIGTAAELIRAGADIHKRSLMGSLVECAVTEDQPKMLSFLLKAGAKPGSSDAADKPLLRAAAENKL